MSAVMWKADSFGRSFDATEVSRALHRYAGRVHGLGCLPKLSSIDKRYFAEINRYLGKGESDLNIKLGTGPDPVTAAIDGYRQAAPEDPIWGVFQLELEAEMIRRWIIRWRKREASLEAALDALTDLLPMVKMEQ